MNRHIRNRLQYHRHLGNTLSALSATAIMLVATLMVAAPAQPSEAGSVARTPEIDAEAIPASAARRQFAASVIQAQADDIEGRAQQLATEMDNTRSAGQAIAHVAAFAVEVATVVAMTAALDELPDAVETTDIATPAPAHSARKHKRNRQSLAMPYFSFASRS